MAQNVVVSQFFSGDVCSTNLLVTCFGPGRENPRTLAPITNGTASTVHSATVQPEGGAQDIVTRERMGHSEEIFLTKPENSLSIGIEPRTWRCYSEVLNR
jgi:hypothetical protein